MHLFRRSDAHANAGTGDTVVTHWKTRQAQLGNNACAGVMPDAFGSKSMFDRSFGVFLFFNLIISSHEALGNPDVSIRIDLPHGLLLPFFDA